jgi:hypothetical protein
VRDSGEEEEAMKRKQEVWRFNACYQLRTSTDGYLNFVAHTFPKGSIGEGEWHIYDEPHVGGVGLEAASGKASSVAEAKRDCALEIQRQLAAHGIKVEIRRVRK